MLKSLEWKCIYGCVQLYKLQIANCLQIAAGAFFALTLTKTPLRNVIDHMQSDAKMLYLVHLCHAIKNHCKMIDNFISPGG